MTFKSGCEEVIRSNVGRCTYVAVFEFRGGECMGELVESSSFSAIWPLLRPCWQSVTLEVQ